MEDLKYPIGRLPSVGRALTAEERTVRIAAIEGHPGNMREAVAGLTEEQLNTPYRDGGWTVRQVVHHLVDSHLIAYFWFKMAVTQDCPAIQTYQPAVWAELADGKSAPIEASLAILDGLHSRWVSFLHSLNAEQFDRKLEHPRHGMLTVDRYLEIFGWHSPHHEAHITSLREREGW